MALKISKRPLIKLSTDQFMRSDADYYRLADSVKEDLKDTEFEFEPLRKYITHLETGKPIVRKDYANKTTGYVHLVVRNIENGKLSLDDPIFLIEEKGKELKQHKLCAGDLVLAISSNVGSCFLYDGSFKETQFTLSHYLVKARFDEEKVDPRFLLYYLTSNVMTQYFRACETGKTQMNLSKQYLYELPFPKIDRTAQTAIVEKMKTVENSITKLEKTIPNTQEVIERVFQDVLEYVPSQRYIQKGFALFKQPFSKLSQRKNVRSGARYNYFWNKYDGMIFQTRERSEAVRLRDVMKPHKTEIFSKGFLPRPYILIDEEDIESKTGVIWNEEYVDKIDSSKILFGDCDLLISKIRPYLGHVILNDKEKPYIGTTELVPYKILDDKVNLKFIQFVLLSNNFLELSKKIMSGKNQPRIQPYELLELKIPLPANKPKDLQEEAVAKIEKELGNLKVKKTNLKTALIQKDAQFWEYLKNSTKLMKS